MLEQMYTVTLKRSSYVCLSVKNWTSFWPTWVTTYVVIMKSLSRELIFPCLLGKKSKKKETSQSKLSFVSPKYFSPSLLCQSSLLHLYRQKLFLNLPLFTTSFHQGQLESQTLPRQYKSFMSVFGSYFHWPCFCLLLSRFLPAPV